MIRPPCPLHGDVWRRHIKEYAVPLQRQYFFSAQASIVLPREYRRKKNELSPFSIKEATDKLPMGICFADPNGRIILCNNRMRRLSFALCGQEPQIKSDMENALMLPDKSVTVKDDCYILPDKTVWQFRKQNITLDFKKATTEKSRVCWHSSPVSKENT